MSVTKCIEICSTSKKSFEDAIVSGLSTASQTLEDITCAEVLKQSVCVEKGKIQTYHTMMKISFSVHEKHS